MINMLTTPKAMFRGESITEDIRWRMLESRWCGNCRTLTSMKLQSLEMKDDSILLEGLCPICGKAVAFHIQIQASPEIREAAYALRI
ncbi:MAG: hypothetical protein WCP55_01095 [Lentisphaerota bacterium]